MSALHSVQCFFLAVLFLSILTAYRLCLFFFFFNDTATTEIYTLSLHDALPILRSGTEPHRKRPRKTCLARRELNSRRSEEHTSELQSPCNLVCRLLLEKKKKKKVKTRHTRHARKYSTQIWCA